MAGRSDGHLLGVVQGDLAIANIEKTPARIEPLAHTDDNEQWPEVSPDGRWLAFGSDVSGRDEVYVQPYPGEGARTAVSLDGGGSPTWNPSGREIFFVSAGDAPTKARMMSADFAAGTPPKIGTPRLLFEFDSRELAFRCVPVRCYDVAPDGERFYVVQTPTPPPPPIVTHINLVLNWVEELKAKVPTK